MAAGSCKPMAQQAHKLCFRNRHRVRWLPGSSKVTALSQEACRRYPRNYYAWTHLMWVSQIAVRILEQPHSSEEQREQSKETTVNNKQARVKSCVQAYLKEELERSSQWVAKHASDYSGWHYRQVCLLERYCWKLWDSNLCYRRCCSTIKDSVAIFRFTVRLEVEFRSTGFVSGELHLT